MIRDEGRAICAALSAIMTGIAYATSAEMARRARRLRELSPTTARRMLRVMRNHRRAAHGEAAGYEKLATAPVPLDHAALPQATRSANMPSPPGTRRSTLGEQHGYRNAQVTVVAPTGTIGLVMDCDTTGIEPDFALVKFKKLAGGGYFKIINRAVPEGLRALGYRDIRDRRDRGLCGRPRARCARRRRSIPRRLKAKGFTDEKIDELEKTLASRLRHQVRLQQMDARRRLPRQHPEGAGREARRSDFRSARLPRLLARPRSKPPTSMSAAP